MPGSRADAPGRPRAGGARSQLPPPRPQIPARRIEVRTVHSIGSAVDDVLIEASTLEARLIVVGARGAGSLRHRVLGSTAERLLRRSLRPVLVVRGAPQASYRRALLALDFSPWSSQALAIARQVAAQARPVLFHVVQVPFEGRLHLAGVEAATVDAYRARAFREARQRLVDVARAAGLADGGWEPCVVDGEASRTIVERAQEQGCDLIVLGKHGTSVTQDLLLGSVTRHVLAESEIDVLVSTGREP